MELKEFSISVDDGNFGIMVIKVKGYNLEINGFKCAAVVKTREGTLIEEYSITDLKTGYLIAMINENIFNRLKNIASPEKYKEAQEIVLKELKESEIKTPANEV
jgi:hypothetical protein